MSLPKYTKKEILSIPNLMGYFRIILIPVYLIIYYHADNTNDYYMAAAVIGLSAVTDFFDGKIARKFNMVTELGKMLDPVADKLTLGFIALSFTFRYPYMRTLLIILLIKECFMLLCGILFMTKGWKTEGANKFGKVCTASLYITMFLLLLFPDIKLVRANLLIILCSVLMIITLISYIRYYTRLFVAVFMRKEDPQAANAKIIFGKTIHKKRRILLIISGTVLIILYLVAGLAVPFVSQKRISDEYMSSIDTSSFYSNETGVDRARIIDDNDEAFDERIRLIASAKERIILSTFDIRSDAKGKVILSALLDASERGVDIKIFVDGYNAFNVMEGNPYFYALSSRDNIEIIIYNKLNPLTPWTSMGRMHDKYLIADDMAYILGGRNTFNRYLRTTDGSFTYDRDVLVYNTEGSSSKDSSLYQIEAYFNEISNQSCCSLFHDSPGNADRTCVKKAADDLHRTYENIKLTRPELFEPYDYAANTFETDRITLVTNPTQIYAKEPVCFHTMIELMKDADSVKIHTPYIVCNDDMLEAFTELADVTDTSIMFNSSANGDNYFACSDYYYYKQDIVDTGMNILEYEGAASYHGKSIAVDDDISVIGSLNMDIRSVYIDTELMLVIDSEKINADLRESMEAYEQSALIVDDEGNYSPENGNIPMEYTDTRMFQIKLFHVISKFRFLF